MKSKWETKKLGDICQIIAGGTPSSSIPEYWNGDISWITPADLSDYPYKYIAQGERNITELGLTKSSAQLLPAQSVLLSTRAPVGYVAIAKNPLATNQGFKNLICKTNEIDNVFLYYWLKNNKTLLENFATGATFPELSATVVKKIKITIPDLPTQKRIADILSSYDDLIENNNKRIELLEKSAQELYKEWFVRFRFPNYENTAFENGLPVGWEIEKLEKLVDIKGGKRLPKDCFLSTEKTLHPYIRIRDITHSKILNLTNNFEYITAEVHTKIKKYITNVDDILISIVGTIGEICCVGKTLDGANLTENCVKLINTRKISNSYLYHFLNSDTGKAALSSGIVGATQPKLPIYNISRIKVIVPPEKIITNFSEKISKIDQQLTNLQEKNQNLIKQRDLLLPRLLSGKLEV